MPFVSKRPANRRFKLLALFLALGVTLGALALSFSSTAKADFSDGEFGSVKVNTAITKNITWTNMNPFPVSVSNIYVGTGTDFTYLDDDCFMQEIISSEGSCTINVQFKPTVAGDRYDTLYVEGTDFNRGGPAGPKTNAIPGTIKESVTLHGIGTEDVVPTPKPTPKPEPPLEIIPQLRVTPDRVAANNPENLITYSFKVKNIGKGTVTGVSLLLPVDPHLVPGFTSFDNPAIWVSSITSDAMSISLPSLPVNQVLEGKITFRPNPANLPEPGYKVFTRYTLFYTDSQGTARQQGSNAVSFEFGPGGSNYDVSGGSIQLLAAGEDGVTFTANFFMPREIVTAWLTKADGTSIAIIGNGSDPSGQITLKVDTSELEPGTYAVSFYGNRSEVTGSATLTVAGK